MIQGRLLDFREHSQKNMKIGIAMEGIMKELDFLGKNDDLCMRHEKHIKE